MSGREDYKSQMRVKINRHMAKTKEDVIQRRLSSHCCCCCCCLGAPVRRSTLYCSKRRCPSYRSTHMFTILDNEKNYQRPVLCKIKSIKHNLYCCFRNLAIVTDFRFIGDGSCCCCCRRTNSRRTHKTTLLLVAAAAMLLLLLLHVQPGLSLRDFCRSYLLLAHHKGTRAECTFLASPSSSFSLSCSLFL